MSSCLFILFEHVTLPFMLLNVNTTEDMRRIILKGTKEQIEAAKIQLLEKVQFYDPVPLKLKRLRYIGPNKP